MATSSFLNNITIRKKKEAESFLNALEKAENKKSKIVKYTARVEDVKDEDSASGNLLCKGGFIKKTSAGIYMMLPLGLKDEKKIEELENTHEVEEFTFNRVTKKFQKEVQDWIRPMFINIINTEKYNVD